MTAPMLEFRADILDLPSGTYQACGKRMLDIVIVILTAPVVLAVLLPILALTALSGGAPLYSHERIGRGGKAFRCWKVRTMVRNADEVLARVLDSDPALALEWQTTQKLANDPRITWLGRLLRRASLDELPQLWNVLRGEMSLVGPRPFMPEQKALYLQGRPDAAYYRLRPGITGLWQVSRRNKGSFAERATFDAEYAENLGFFADASILFRTVAVVVLATGL